MDNEKPILGRIEELVEEEHRLRSAFQRGTLTSQQERERLRQVEIALDQCWDLLRRRRATRDSGGDPGAVTARPPEEVESYLQ